MMEEGTLSDTQGRKVDFHQHALIMTSMLAPTRSCAGSLGFTLESVESNEGRVYQDMRQKLLGQLRKLFRPEFTQPRRRGRRLPLAQPR